MNKNFVRFAFAGIACAAFCTTTFAAPKGGHHGGNGRPAMAPQQARAPQGGNGRPAMAPQQARAPHGGNGHTTRALQQARVPNNTRPAPRTGAVTHAAPTHHVNKPAAARHGNFRPEPRHNAPPPRFARHHIPSHARYWARPAVPLWRIGALRAWEWIVQEWVIVVNGVYYYGDGYYYDGYNYYYNGEYHTVPPPLLTPTYF